MKNLLPILAAVAMTVAACGPAEEGGKPVPPTPPTPPTPPAVVRVTGVEMSASPTLQIGDTQTLTATVLPADATDKSVTWASSDESVATVAGGKVTAVDVGSATITVTTTDGAKTATCTVLVMPAPAPDDILTMIPDPAFRAVCEYNMTNGYSSPIVHDKWDTDDDGKLSPEEAAAVTIIWAEYKEIVSLAGIEYFTGLKQLLCPQNKLTSLDVSKNSALTHLDCSHNFNLTSLDVSKNSALTHLNCDWAPLTSLDVSGCIALTRLHCVRSDVFADSLTELDLSKNTALVELVCGGNQLLTELDLSNNTALTHLDIGGEDDYRLHTRLTKLDVSMLPDLQYLNCAGSLLTELDLSKNLALVELNCKNNRMVELDISKNRALVKINSDGNGKYFYDPSKNNGMAWAEFTLKAWFDKVPSGVVYSHSVYRYIDSDGDGVFTLPNIRITIQKVA